MLKTMGNLGADWRISILPVLALFVGAPFVFRENIRARRAHNNAGVPSAHNEKRTRQLLRNRLLFWTESAEDYYDRHALGVFCLLMGVFTVWAWLISQAKPLWFDELLGLSAATAPRLQGVWWALSRPVDINPPMYHVLARLSISFLGYSALAARLPAFLGMLLFLLCLFAFVSRRLSPSYGVLGTLLVLCTNISWYASDARPYGVILGLTGLAMVSYQRRIQRGDLTSLIVFFLVCCCLPLTHYYGTLVIGPFLAAEVARTIEQKRIDWLQIIGTLLAPAVTLFLLRDLIRSQKPILAHYHSQGSLTSFLTGADLISIPAWAICIGIAALALGNWLGAAARDKRRTVIDPEFSGPELVLAVSLLSLPFLGAIITTFTHAYFSRYFMAASAGYVVLICYLAASFHRRCVGVALLLSMVAVTVIATDLMRAVKHRHDPQPLANLQPVLGKLDLPVVFQDAKDYVVARELNPDISDRFYYAAEPELALKVTGTDSDDKLMRGLAAVQPQQVSRLDDMARKSEYWIVVPASFGWLVPCLTEMGADMQPVSWERSHGQIAFSGFRVRFPSRGPGAMSWCEAAPSSAP